MVSILQAGDALAVLSLGLQVAPELLTVPGVQSFLKHIVYVVPVCRAEGIPCFILDLFELGSVSLISTSGLVVDSPLLPQEPLHLWGYPREVVSSARGL